MSKSFSSALSLVGGILLCFLFVQNTVAQVVPADASMKVTRVDQNMNPINGTQVQIFGVERDTTGVIGIRRIYSPLYTTNPTIFTTDLQNINNQLAASGKSYYSGVSLSVTDLPYYNEYLGACSGENCTPGGFYRMFGGMARSFCNGTVCTEAEDLGFGGNLFIKYVPSPDVCPAGKVPFPDVTSVPCFLRSTMKVGGGTELKLEATPNLVGSCSLKETYQQRSGNSYISYPVTPAVAGKLSVSSSGASIVANTSTNIAIGEDTLPNLLTCPTGYTAMCSISDAGSNLCGCYWPHIQTESWAPVKPFNFTCVDSVSTCSEGQYFCSAENICKTTGQTCGTTDWVDVPLVGTESFDINAEYRYKISSQTGSWLYAKEVSARNLVTNESYSGQIFYVSADNKNAYQYNGNFLDTVVQIQKRTLPTWTDVIINNTDPFNTAYEYRFKMTVPGRPGVPAGDFWYYAKQVGVQSLVMDNGYGEITFVSAANKTAYLSQGTPTGITISQMQRRALTWNDVPLNTTDAYDVSCEYRFKMNYPASPQWRPGVPAGDFWHYPERASAQSLIANANGGYQTFSVFANNKAVFDFNGVNNNTVLQMQKLCNAPVSLSSTCGNPRAQVNFTPYTGIPAADQNSSTNAWDSITLGNKAVVAGGTFFDLTDGTNAIDDGTIVSTGLQNFAVSRHNGYIEFLALGRRLSTYYGYYQGTIRFQNVQVDRVEPGLTTETWADIGLEATEGDTVTKVSDSEVSFKLAFANQGDGFRVYLKNPTPTECTCPAGQEKKPDPKSPVCIVRALIKGVQDTEFILTGYDHLSGNCTLAAGTPQAPQTPSTEITVTAGQQRTSWMQGSPWTFQLDPLLTCPANTTKTACMFTYGAGPLGEITCGCYPNGFTTKTFTDPLVQGRPVYSRDGSPAQFCREQGYTERALVKRVENLIGAGSLWNGQVWEINQNLEIIKEVECSNEPNTVCHNFYEPRVHGKPVFARDASPAQFCREQGYGKSATVNKEYSYEGNGSLWNGSVWEINLNLAAIREVNCCKLEDKSSQICVDAGCAAGQYWCQAENMCKPAGQSCSTVTCNNNNTCEAGESCNCGDCTNGGNDDADKCGLSNGSQMVCTKDKDNSTTAAPFSSVTAQENFNIVNNKLAAKLSQYGNANISAGEFAPLDTELQMTQDSQLTYFPSFTKEEAWARVKVLLSIPASAQVLWFTSSIKYENDALGDNERYLYSYVIEEASGVRKQILFATEYLPSVSLGYRKVYLIGKDFPIPQTSSGPVQVGACCPAGKQWSSSTGQCVTKTVDECLEGQYYCNAESTCKPANQACGTVTCNNDGICNEYESCNCADCNQVADHCATNTLGQQLLCSKDVIPVPSAVNTYFGGIYSPGYNHPITGGQSCPTGYTATQISGTENVDPPLYVCTRKVSDTSLPAPTQYFDFGGMWGTSGGFTWHEDVFGPRIKATDTLDMNPYTGGQSCPAGYTTQKVLGDTKYMGPLWACSCGGYTSMISTTNLTSGETCMFGNGGTEANTQYSSWSCTQLQSGTSGTPLYTGPLYNCTCGGYMNRLSTTNLTSGETCMFGNGGTVNNDQYSTWSCTQLQSGTSGAPLYTGPLYKSTCGGYMNMVTTSNLTFGETCIFGNGGTAANVQFSAWTSTPLTRSEFDHTLNYCWKARTTAPTLANEDFGGMWGMRGNSDVWGGINYNNPVTGVATCPTGYTTKIGWGTSNVDWLFRWCHRGSSVQAIDTTSYTTESDGSRLYTNPKKNNRPLSAVQKDMYIYIADSASVFCREQGFYQAVVLDQETTTEMLTQWDDAANNWSTAPGASTGGTSTKNVTPTPAGARIKTLKCAVTTPNQGMRVFTNTISRFLGKYAGTYDDYRGGAAGVTVSQGIGNICGTAGYYKFDDAEVAGVNYKCNDGATPTRHFHNGGAIDNNGGGGSGWCASTSVEWVLCKPKDITLPLTCFTPPAGYTPAATPPALPATAKYQRTSLLADGTVNDGISGYSAIPCDNCYLPGAKAGQPNPISFKIPSNAGATGSGKYYAFDIISNAVFINMCLDNVDLKIFFNTVLQHSFTTTRTSVYAWGLRIVPDNKNPGYGWVGKRKNTAYNRYYLVLDKDNASYENWQYLKIPDEVKFDYKQTVVDHCPGSKGTGGSWMYYYGFIADAGFDVSKVATAALPICQTQTTTATTTTTTRSPAIPQIGACCPAGSAWNSVEKRCIPTTCGEGQFYCAAQKKCLAGGTTCETTNTCINDSVCSGDESCQCADCVDGGTDDKDKCSVIGGVQAMCSDDNLTDNKPGACCIPPKKWNTATNTCVECSNTQAPSELKAGVDEPYITCTGNGDTTKTHFKYRITKQGVTEAPFISEMYTIGTQVLHPTMTLGDYTVECFYGNSTSVDTSTTAAPHSCVKTMSVKSDAQGCSRVYPYKGSTLSDEMTSTFAFDASFRCGSRKPIVGTITNPYMFRIGTQPISYLSFDSLISELFNGLTIGPVSTQTQNYNFNTGTTDVTCATKVGGGYSTNNACRLTACAGGNCNTPQTFSVVHSDDLTCTTEDTSNYNIGCNPAAPDSVRNQCIQWFRDAITAGSRNVTNGVEFDVSFVFNADAPTNVKCIKYVAGQMPGGLNLSDNVVCSAPLNNGERYQIYAADTNGRIDALQTTAKTVERDRENPTISEIKYYTDDTLTTEVPTTNWYNKPVLALAVCSDTPLNEATSCACSKTVDPATTDAAFWSVGVPNSLIGADLMRYVRTITESTTGAQKVLVTDTAGNKSQEKNIAVSLDTQVPLVTTTESGTGTTKTITLTASDTGSKIWKTTTAPSGSPAATNTNGIIYRVGPKADMQTLAFDAECNTTSSFATVAETKTASFPSQAIATVSVNTATHVVAYCVRDNAGNTTRGIYPVTTNACFSSSNMATIPTLDTYKDLLKTRLSGAGTDNQKYGYSFSENTADANCFRGILSNNVTTLMANQLKAKTATTLSNWDTDRSQLSTSTTLSNGYYYYVYPTSNTLDIVTSPASSGAPVKTVVVDGGDIRIKTDLIYSGAGKTLLIIARKNTNGQGGNIIIDTNVKRIDAILIADGGALKSSDATLPGERLTINGRIYSYNTRGGSLSVSGVDLIDAAVPKRFTNASLVNAGSLTDARVQDLERFRPMFADGTNTCSLTVNYTAFTTANLPALLKRPSTFAGGSCGF